MTQEPSPESIRLAMDQAWRDHQHTRNQTWKALQIEVLIAAGLIGINWQSENMISTIVAGVLVMITSLCGMQITVHHRNKVETLKFEHIENCQKALYLNRQDLISEVKPPLPIKIWHIFRPTATNTALFILRMHFTIFIFGVLFLIWRLFNIFGSLKL